MATGKINALEVGNGSGPVTLTKQSAAKAWVNAVGTGTIAINDSFNISSIADNGTGRYTITYASNMNGGNYNPGVEGTANSSGNYYTHGRAFALASDSVQVTGGNSTSSSHAPIDLNLFFCDVDGDLA